MFFARHVIVSFDSLIVCSAVFSIIIARHRIISLQFFCFLFFASCFHAALIRVFVFAFVWLALIMIN